MYGEIPIAKSVPLANAPPDTELKIFKKLYPSMVDEKTSLSIPGTGIKQPILYTIRRSTVMIIFFLTPLSLNALTNVLNITFS